MEVNLRFKILPVVAYTIPTFVLVYPSFFISYLSKNLDLAYWEVFTLVAVPFLGRLIGSLIYQFLRLNSYFISFLLLGIFTILQSIINIYLLIFIRFFVGILFGILTTFAVEYATKSGDNLILGLTTGGWSLGWILAYLLFIMLNNWHLIAIAGMFIILLAILGTGNFSNNIIVEKRRLRLPSTISIITYICALTPAFLLEIVPNILERINMIWIVLPSYFLSLIVYIILPLIVNKLGLKIAMIIIPIIILTSGIFAFLFCPFIFLVFTPFGLAVLSIIPKYLTHKGENPKRLGLALNIGSVMGLIIPVLSNIIPYFPEIIIVITMLSLILTSAI